MTYPSALEMKRDMICALALEAFNQSQKLLIKKLMAKPKSEVSVQQVLDIFTCHNGRVPGFEFGDHLDELLAKRWIAKSPCHLDGDCYVTGPDLPMGIKSGGAM